MAFGYLSVLIGSLCLDHDVKIWVGRGLQEGNINHLVNALEEFLQYYRKVGQEVSRGDGAKDSVGYVRRLQGLVDELKS